MDSEFQFVAKSAEIQEGKGRPYQVGDHRVALVRYQGTVYAIEDLCPHANASMAFGPVEEGCLICPWHYAAFDLATGEARGGPVDRGVPTYEVIEENDQILIKTF